MVISKVEMERKSWTTRVEAKKKTMESVKNLVDGCGYSDQAYCGSIGAVNKTWRSSCTGRK